MSLGEEEGTPLLFQSPLGTSSAVACLDVSYSSCLMDLRLNISLIEHTSHMVNSVLRQNMSILNNVKKFLLLMSTGMESF